MLHLILGEETVYGDDAKVAVAIMMFGRQSSIDHIQQRVGTGYCVYRTVEGFPQDAHEAVRFNDAIAISDEFTDKEIAKVINEWQNQVPVLILSAYRALSKRSELRSILDHSNVAIVDVHFYAIA